MSITYKRTMNMKYANTKLKDYHYYELLHSLDDWGINVSNKYGTSPVGKYDKVTTAVISECLVDGKPMFTSPYQWLSASIVKDMRNNGWQNVEFNVTNEETIQSVWHEPKGTHINLTNMSTDELMKFTGVHNEDYVRGYNLQYSIPDDEKVILTSSLTNSGDGLVLSFNISWESARVKKAATIKERMVDNIISDVGLIQHIFENSVQQCFRDVADEEINFLHEPELECYFEHITESKTECSPDIVALTREARLKHGENNE